MKIPPTKQKLCLQLCLGVSVCFSAQAQDELRNAGTIRMHTGANMAVYGDLTNNGTFTNNSGTIYFLGSSTQTIDGTGVPDANNMTIDNSNGIQLDVEYQITGTLTFTDGIITTVRANSATEFLHFMDNATVTGMSNSNHVDGVVRKTGNDAFTFPLGDGGVYLPLSISAPSVVTDQFAAEYISGDPDADYSVALREPTIHHISRVDYWLLDRTNGASDVEVTLSYVTASGVTDQADIIVARWDGSEWVDEGSSGTTGDTDDGTVTSNAAITAFGEAFTLGSISPDNPLPIEWMSFIAYYQGHDVKLDWSTAVEINNDYFTIERSEDGVSFTEIGRVKGKGNKLTQSLYTATDHEPLAGTSYYRIKQTDYDGSSTYTEIRSVRMDIGNRAELLPNPATSDNLSLLVSADQEGEMIIKIYDAEGRIVYDNTLFYGSGQYRYAIQPESQLLPGFYTLVGHNGNDVFQKKFIIRDK